MSFGRIPAKVNDVFSNIEQRVLPERAFLQRFADDGDYTDCFMTEVGIPVNLTEYIEAFYTTVVFKTERIILRWLASRPSTDAEAQQLAQGSRDSFAAWNVVERADDQILLMGMRGRTCSWLMRAPVDDSTRLYFGSAVIKSEESPSGPQVPRSYRSLLGFHRLYSKVLLDSARRRLIRKVRTGSR